MFQHFTFKPMPSKKRLRKDYRISFYYKGTYFRAVYRYNGKIDWDDTVPADDEREKVESQIHELMLFHVYDR
ncbi:MAG TPA: DUF5342 family protein [Bacillales bacterium]|nr:DUF5342 family protein [Bacillales bacterium]